MNEWLRNTLVILAAEIDHGNTFLHILQRRIVIDGLGLPKINCNNKEVRLTQAYAVAPLSHLNLYNPDESVQGKLVPLLSKPFQEDGDPVFAVQVTEFSCGGIVVGCTFDHRVADAYSTNMFFSSWAALSRNDSTVSPNHAFHTLLCALESTSLTLLKLKKCM